MLETKKLVTVQSSSVHLKSLSSRIKKLKYWPP